VIGNEDGAHAISASYQAFNDVGFTISAQAVTYWNGEAMHIVDHQGLSETPPQTAQATAPAATNAVHLARLLEQENYPATPE
jgi:hypothetical protein